MQVKEVSHLQAMVLLLKTLGSFQFPVYAPYTHTPYSFTVATSQVTDVRLKQ